MVEMFFTLRWLCELSFSADERNFEKHFKIRISNQVVMF